MKILIFILFFLSTCTYKNSGIHNEKYYQTRWCRAEKGQMEVIMSDKTRCDCLTATHAVEIDFAGKWAEAIGQSLHYARLTGKYPGIVLICRGKKDRNNIARARLTTDFYIFLNIKIWTINCNFEKRQSYLKNLRS